MKHVGWLQNRIQAPATHKSAFVFVLCEVSDISLIEKHILALVDKEIFKFICMQKVLIEILTVFFQLICG